MNRRWFLRKAGGVLATVVTVATVAAPARESDDFMYRGYRVIWTGWKRLDAQLVTYGVWAAFKGNRFRYMTTCGNGCDAGELDTLDLTWNRKAGWPSPSDINLWTPAEREVVKRRALTELLETL